MPQMKSADISAGLDTASTDSSVFELDKPRNTESSWSVMSGATSSSSVHSSLSADGLPSELVSRGPSTSQIQHPPPQSPYSLVPSLMELTTNDRVKAAGLRNELQGFMNKVMDMEDQLNVLKKKLVNKQKYISTLETNLKRIESNNVGLKTEVVQLGKDNDRLRMKLNDSQSASGQVSPTRHRQELLISPVPSEREAQLGCELDRVLQENASLKQKIQGLEEELSQTIQQLELRKSRHEQRRQDMEMLLMQASKELEHVEAERDETARLLSEVLNKSAGAGKEEGGGVKTQFESLLMLQKPSVTAKELISIKDRLFAAHKQIDVLETDFREEHEQRLCAERDLARMKATIRDLERECDTLRLQVQFIQEDFYREREDKRVLERNLKSSKEHTFHTRIVSNERAGSSGESHLHMYQGLDPSGLHQMMEYSRPHSACRQRTTHYCGGMSSDVECDNNSGSGINAALPNQESSITHQ